MCSCLQGDETSRYLSKGLLHCFRCRRHFLFQNDFACFIQNTVERPTISQIHTDRQLLLLQNFITRCLHSANLLHRRSPFLCLEHVEHWERIVIPLETGLLIPSGNASGQVGIVLTSRVSGVIVDLRRGFHCREQKLWQWVVDYGGAGVIFAGGSGLARRLCVSARISLAWRP